jgi:hypothetical protein
VTPKIFGLLLTGILVLFIVIFGWIFLSAVEDEKTVTDDFGAESCSFLSSSHGMRMAR